MKSLQKQLRVLAELFGRLYDRWQDEGQYEDFEEYKLAVKNNLPPCAELISMKQRPFEMVFEWDGVRRYMRATSKDVVWGIIK